MLEQPRKRKKNVVEGGSLGKRGEQVSGRTQEIVKRWEREPGEVRSTTRSVEPSARTVSAYEKAFSDAQARTAAHAAEKRQAERRAAEAASAEARQRGLEQARKNAEEQRRRAAEARGRR